MEEMTRPIAARDTAAFFDIVSKGPGYIGLNQSTITSTLLFFGSGTPSAVGTRGSFSPKD